MKAENFSGFGKLAIHVFTILSLKDKANYSNIKRLIAIRAIPEMSP